MPFAGGDLERGHAGDVHGSERVCALVDKVEDGLRVAVARGVAKVAEQGVSGVFCVFHGLESGVFCARER